MRYIMDNIEAADSEADLLKLGGSIELSGFSSIDRGSMIILKKIIGNYARKLSDNSQSFEALKLRVKTVHDSIFELNCQVVDGGNVITSSVEDRNIFVAVDSALKKISEQM
jgi:hypothetical protein